MGRIKMVLAATALMVAMLTAMAMPAMADDFDHLGNFRGFAHDHDHDFGDHNGDEEEEIDIDRIGGCIAVIEEEDDDGREEEDLEALFCPRVNVFGNVEFVRVD